MSASLGNTANVNCPLNTSGDVGTTVKLFRGCFSCPPESIQQSKSVFLLIDMVWWPNVGGRCTAGLDDHGGLFQPRWFYDCSQLLEHTMKDVGPERRDVRRQVWSSPPNTEYWSMQWLTQITSPMLLTLPCNQRSDGNYQLPSSCEHDLWAQVGWGQFSPLYTNIIRNSLAF